MINEKYVFEINGHITFKFFISFTISAFSFLQLFSPHLLFVLDTNSRSIADVGGRGHHLRLFRVNPHLSQLSWISTLVLMWLDTTQDLGKILIYIPAKCPYRRPPRQKKASGDSPSRKIDQRGSPVKSSESPVKITACSSTKSCCPQQNFKNLKHPR